jgi:hypothetical protein
MQQCKGKLKLARDLVLGYVNSSTLLIVSENLCRGKCNKKSCRRRKLLKSVMCGLREPFEASKLRCLRRSVQVEVSRLNCPR